MPEQDRARRYHDPRYRAILADVALGLGLLAVVAFTAPGQALASTVDPMPDVLGAFALGVGLIVLSAVLRFPLTVWLGLTHERAFGFSRQSRRDRHGAGRSLQRGIIRRAGGPAVAEHALFLLLGPRSEKRGAAHDFPIQKSLD